MRLHVLADLRVAVRSETQSYAREFDVLISDRTHSEWLNPFFDACITAAFAHGGECIVVRG